MTRHGLWVLCCGWVLLWFAAPYDFFYTVKARPDLDARLDDADQGERGRKIALPILALVAGASVCRRRRARFRVNSVLGLAILAFLALSAIGILWADNAAFTAKKVAVLGMLGLVVFAVAISFSVSEIMKITFAGCAVTFLVSLVAELTFGTFRPWEVGYMFSGLGHPNQQGINMALLVLSVFGIMRTGRPKASRTLTLTLTLIATISVGFLLLTRSRASFASFLVASVCCWWLTANSKRRVFAIVALGVAVGVAGLAIGDAFLATAKNTVLLGRADEENAGSLSKRIPLWGECVAYLSARPIGGYGYDSFWNSKRVYEISSHQEWAIGEVHNGYLEMALGVGIPGAACYGFILMMGVWLYFRLYRVHRLPEDLWALSILIWFCLNNLLETISLQPLLPPIVCFALLAKVAFVPPARPAAVSMT